MKRLYILLVLALSTVAFVGALAAQGMVDWPRNGTTNAIEFTGKRTFKGAAAKPDNIERFVSAWIRDQTDDSALASESKFSSKGFLYEGLVLGPLEKAPAHKFLFMVSVQRIPNGFTYKLSNFSCIFSNVGGRVNTTSLEAMVGADNANHLQALSAFRERLDSVIIVLGQKPG